jgi:hypothetical protein
MRNTSHSANPAADSFWKQAESYLMNGLCCKNSKIDEIRIIKWLNQAIPDHQICVKIDFCNRAKRPPAAVIASKERVLVLFVEDKGS